MSTLAFKKKTLVSTYGVILLIIIASSFFVLFPDIDYSVRNLIFFVLLSVVIISLDFPRETKYLASIMFVSFMFWNHFSYDPIQTPDSVGYYNVFNRFNSYGELMSQWWWDLFNDGPYQGYVQFGAIFYPFHALFNYYDEYFIAVFNSILMIFSIYIIYLIGKNHFKVDLRSKHLFLSALVLGLFTSGSLYFYSTVFLKDITNLLICLLALYALLNKKYFWFIFTFLLASHTRIYSVAIIFFYYVFVKKNLRLAVLGLIGCMLFLGYKTGIIGFVNVNVSAISLLVSPNPFSLENWREYELRSFETLVIAIGSVLSAFLLVVSKESRKLIIIFLIVIYSYACIMTAVGYNWYDQRGWDYQVGIVGDNVARKKLPLLGIIYLMMTYSFIKSMEKIIKKKPTE